MNKKGVKSRMSKRNAILFNVSVILSVAMAYILIRGVLKPTDGFGRFYATDLLFGIALPSLFYLLAMSSQQWLIWISSLHGKLILVSGASLVWEGIIPILIAGYTADIVDVVCYFVGTMIQHLLFRISA